MNSISLVVGNVEELEVIADGYGSPERRMPPCGLTVAEEANKKKKICDDEEVKKSKISSQLIENYENLMDNDDFKDFVLKCAGEEIRVHKCILAARSPVFATMFKTDEAKDNSAVIVDVDPSILQKLLKFIYSGQIDDFTKEEAVDLLYAANKYQLDILKEECIQSLKQNLSDKNVFDAVKFGDSFDHDLKDRAMDFVMKKHGSFAKLRETEGWKSLHAANPALAMEIVTAIEDHTQKRSNADYTVVSINELQKYPPLQPFMKMISLIVEKNGNTRVTWENNELSISKP